ncbi:hypothetical protein [Haloferula sp.]|uniref:hypothetical protein n=1 Tax=Haloferula sp. TaxID=2497595 RepID=UPI00329FF6C6
MRILVTLLILLFPAVGHSQNTSGEARQVQCRFLIFGGVDKPKLVNATGPKDSTVPCPLSASKISDPVSCVAKGNKIKFTSEGEGTPLAIASIPSGVRAAILIFVPQSKDTSLPWKVILIEDSAKNFPDGGAFVANFHGDNIRFIIGEHKGALRPAQTQGYARPENRDSFNMAPVIFEFRQKDKWRKGNESALRFLPGIRYLIFAYTDPKSKRPKINTYQDFRSVSTSTP